MQGNREIIIALLCFKADPRVKNNEGVSIFELWEKIKFKYTNLQIGYLLRLARDSLLKQNCVGQAWNFCDEANIHHMKV